jgi:hypothetical protein
MICQSNPGCLSQQCKWSMKKMRIYSKPINAKMPQRERSASLCDSVVYIRVCGHPVKSKRSCSHCRSSSSSSSGGKNGGVIAMMMATACEVTTAHPRYSAGSEGNRAPYPSSTQSGLTNNSSSVTTHNVRYKGGRGVCAEKTHGTMSTYAGRRPVPSSRARCQATTC